MAAVGNDRQTKPHESYTPNDEEPKAPEPTAGVGNLNPVGAVMSWVSSGMSYVAETGSNLWYGKPKENQDAFETKFNGKGLTPGQRLSFLSPAEHSRLGFNAKEGVSEGMLIFYKRLLFDEMNQVKEMFREILKQIDSKDLLLDLVTALHQPELEKSKGVLDSFNAALRNDLGFLAERTKVVLVSTQIPKEQKIVYFTLLLNHDKVTKEIVSECLDKMPKDTQAMLLNGDETIDKIKELEVQAVKQRVAEKLDPIAILDVIMQFQVFGPGSAVTELHQKVLPENYHQALLNAQAVAKEAKDTKKKEAGEETKNLTESYIPGTTVNRRLLNPFGETMNHFDGGAYSKPRGDVAIEAVKIMSAELIKQKK
ncbi:MAG: hypothetical protein KDK63_04245 [Chlamydiia bacterium]|nr:hypothetical protein [Chlamydiia bacterium]